MEVKVITVQKIEKATKNNRSWWRVVSTDGGLYNIFPTAEGYGLLNENTSMGLAYKLELEANEKNPNFKDVKKVMFPDIPEMKAAAQSTGKTITVGKDNRAFAMAYAKDLAVAKLIPLSDLLAWAETLRQFMDGDITVDVMDVAKLIRSDEKKSKKEPQS